MAQDDISLGESIRNFFYPNNLSAQRRRAAQPRDTQTFPRNAPNMQQQPQVVDGRHPQRQPNSPDGLVIPAEIQKLIEPTSGYSGDMGGRGENAWQQYHGDQTPLGPTQDQMGMRYPTYGDSNQRRDTPRPAMNVDRGQSGRQGSGLYDQRVAQAIIQQYTAAGYDPEFAAGMAANAMIESAGNPTAYNKSEGAFGLFQHRLDRLDNMRSFADRLGKDINDIGTQISFSIHEFSAGERMAYDRIMGGGAESADDYARLIDKYWERSDGSARDKRAKLASEIYGDFFGDDAQLSPDRAPLSYGTDIDPYGTDDNVALQSAYADPEMFKTFEQYDKLAQRNSNPLQDFMLGGSSDMDALAPEVPDGGDFGMGEAVPNAPAQPTAPPAPMQATQSTQSQPAAQPTTEESTMQGGLQKFLDRIYKTEDLSDEERGIRRTAMVQAFAESLNALSGRAVDMDGVYDRKSAAYQNLSDKQKEEADARQQEARAGAIAQMATSAGLGQVAGLAYMGEGAQGQLIGQMVRGIGQGKGSDYSVSPESREQFANQIEPYNPALATTIRTANGKALEDAMGAALKFEPPTDGDTDGPIASAGPTADRFRTLGADPDTISAIENAGSAEELKASIDLAKDSVQGYDNEPMNNDFQTFRGMYGQEALDELMAGDPERQQQFENVAFRLAQAKGGVNQSSTPAQERAVSRIAAQDQQLDDAAVKARSIGSNMEVIRQQALSSDFKGGLVEANVLLPLQNMAESFGLDTSMLAQDGGPLRLVQAVSREMATLARTEGAGSTSNFDAQNYLLTGPRETDTRNNILMLSQFHKYDSQRILEEQKLRDEYLDNNSTSPDYYDINKLNQYVEENMTRKDIFPTIVQKPGMTEDDVNAQVEKWAATGQIEEGDMFIIRDLEGNNIYSGYGIPNFSIGEPMVQ